MGGYIIFHYKILDSIRIEELGPQSLPILHQHNGELMVASSVTPLEGSPYPHVVVYKFPTQAAAMGYFHSGEIQELSKLRREITDGFAVYVPEYENG